MENFNKNWLAILLIAVVFGVLGFLVGRVTAHPPRPMMWTQKDGMEKKVDVKIETDDTEMEGEVSIDTVVKDGKKIIIKEIKKTK
jgi:hypothetical protein